MKNETLDLLIKALRIARAAYLFLLAACAAWVFFTILKHLLIF